MKTTYPFLREILIVALLSLSTESSFAQNIASIHSDYGIAKKFSTPGAYLKQIKFIGESPVTLIHPASEGFKILMEEDASQLKFIEKRTEGIVAKITNFRIKNIDNINYLRWTAQNDSISGIFILESSIDTINFNPVWQKEMIASDFSVKVLYCWTDINTSDSETKYYRLLTIGDDGIYNYSKIMEVIHAKKEFPKEHQELSQ